MVIAPKLETLKTTPCTLEELQAALVQLIEMHNALNKMIGDLISSGRIKSPEDARADELDKPYGL